MKLSLSEIQADIYEFECALKLERFGISGLPSGTKKVRTHCCGAIIYRGKLGGGSIAHKRKWCNSELDKLLDKRREELQFRIQARQYARRL